MSYFAVEINTGAVNGFFTKKQDCEESTKNLSNRFKGSKWIVGEKLKEIGNEHHVIRDAALQQDRGMRGKLTDLFFDADLK